MSYDLERFVTAQVRDYEIALNEIRNGRKKEHWMWYIFPQLEGLGRSYTSMKYGIKGIGEAEAYLNHEILGKRLVEISEALLALESNDAESLFGWTDSKKLKSSMALFSQVENAPTVFEAVLKKYFQGLVDKRTLKMLAEISNKS